MSADATRRISRVRGSKTLLVVRDIWVDIILNETRYADVLQGVSRRGQLIWTVRPHASQRLCGELKAGLSRMVRPQAQRKDSQPPTAVRWNWSEPDGITGGMEGPGRAGSAGPTFAKAMAGGGPAPHTTTAPPGGGGHPPAL